MAIHDQNHTLISTDNHTGGGAATTNEVNVLGTNDANAIVQVAVEEGGVASTTSKIVKRAADGHIAVPQSGQTAGEVLSKTQIEDLIAAGTFKASVHSVVADHTAATVGDTTPTGDQTTDPALAVDDIVVNTTDKKLYTVTSIAGGTTGNLCTYDAGTAPVTAQSRIDKSNDNHWTYDPDGDVWINQGLSDHARAHTLTSASDHTGGNDKVIYTGNAGAVTELALAALGRPLLSQGTTSAPIFGSLAFASAPISAAGATPVDTDVSAWANDTIGVVVGTGGRIWAAYKNATDVYYAELTAI